MTGPVPSLESALRRLFKRTAHGIRPGLEIERALLEALGSPHVSLPAVQVAGTNGKGSVCAMLESILRVQGLKTGLYISPHLVDFRERFRVGGEVIAEGDLAGLLDELEGLAVEIARRPGAREATFFEISTAVAFEHFRRQKVELAVLETGMGGSWDATNLASPLLSVITRIDIDHVEFLGSDLGSIAKEKSGIIKAGRPAVCGPMPEAAREVVRARALETGSRLVCAEDVVSVARLKQSLDGQRLRISSVNADYPPVTLPLLGSYQLENVAVAVAAAETLAGGLGVEIAPEAMCEGLSKARWAGRCQVISREPVVIIDGAHNPCGAKELARTLGELAGDRPVGLVVGFLREKDGAGFMKHMASVVDRCWALAVHSERAMPVDGVAGCVEAAGLRAERSSLDQALRDGEAWARACGGVLCIAGSLYLAGEALVHYGFDTLKG